ncbi:MAG: hypothetical protein R3B69_03720 [Candidatus Paceibacterota bacterium]
MTIGNDRSNGPSITSEDIQNLGIMLMGELKGSTASRIQSGNVTESDIQAAGALVNTMITR